MTIATKIPDPMRNDFPFTIILILDYYRIVIFKKNVLSRILLYLSSIVENNRLNDPGFGCIGFYVFLGYQIQMPGRNII